MSTHRSAHGALSRVLCWLVVVAIAAVVTVAVLIPRAFGGTPYVILTGSMQPSIPPGSLVVTRPVAADTLGLGQVITYQRASGEPTVVTHRVVAQGVSAAGEKVFRTQGDANTAADPGWIRPVQIRGERWYDVPYLGYLTSAISAPVRQALQTAIVAGLLLYAAFMFTSGLRDRVRTRQVAR